MNEEQFLNSSTQLEVDQQDSDALDSLIEQYFSARRYYEDARHKLVRCSLNEKRRSLLEASYRSKLSLLSELNL